MTCLRRDPPRFPSPTTFPRLTTTRRRMSGGVVWVQPPATRITLGREMAGFTAVLVLHGFNSAATIGKHGCHRPPTAGWRAPRRRRDALVGTLGPRPAAARCPHSLCP